MPFIPIHILPPNIFIAYVMQIFLLWRYSNIHSAVLHVTKNGTVEP